MPSRHHSSSSHHSSSHHHSTPSHHIHHTDSSLNDPYRVMRPRTSGGGCGIVGFVAIAIFIVGGIIFFAVRSSTPTLVDNSTSTPSSAVALEPGAAPADPALEATTTADLKVMHRVLDKELSTWMKDKTIKPHFVSPEDAGLPGDFNTREVVYGYCDASDFYMYVINITPPDGVSADSEGYAYTPGSSASACEPPGWKIVTTESATEPDWTFVTIDTSAAPK